MTLVCRSLAAAAFALWLSAVAFGQPPATPALSAGPFSNPYGRSLEWLANPQVQEELKLTDDQWDRIKQAQEEMRKKVRDVYSSLGSNERDPQKRAQKYRERFQALGDEAEAKARAILRKEQAERLKQIIWQTQMSRGSPEILDVLLDKELSADLGLSDEQRDHLRRKQAAVFEQNREKLRAFYRQLYAETRETLLAELTADQRKKLEARLGPNYEFKPDAVRTSASGPAGKEAKPKQ